MASHHTIVRRAVPDDGPAMGSIHVAAWRVGYAGLLPWAFLDGLDASAFARIWTERLLRPAARSQQEHLVAVVDGRVCAMSTIGPYRPSPHETGGRIDPAAAGELWMLNAHPTVWGTGVARYLIDAAVARLGSTHPHCDAALWVLEGNARGRRFYEKVGWQPDGARKTDTIGGSTVTEVRYVLDLDSPDAGVIGTPPASG